MSKWKMAAPMLTYLKGIKVAALVQRPLVRCLSTSSVCAKNLRSGCYKTTTNRSKGLTYEQANQPYKIGVRKGWNSWNTSNLHEETAHTGETTVEDMFIRKFMLGTWHRLFLSEIIIKRRHNLVIIAGLVSQSTAPRKMYFLIGYTEELLANLLKRPVKLEIQTVQNKKDMIFKWI